MCWGLAAQLDMFETTVTANGKQDKLLMQTNLPLRVSLEDATKDGALQLASAVEASILLRVLM